MSVTQIWNQTIGYVIEKLYTKPDSLVSNLSQLMYVHLDVHYSQLQLLVISLGLDSTKYNFKNDY
jgi:hypothetical protein